MPVRRDPRTGGWYFRTIVKLADGTRRRIFGTPGTPGPYQDLAPTKVGAKAAEDRAKVEALTGNTPTIALARKKEVLTVAEYRDPFMASYKPGQKPSERRKKEQILEHHILPVFGAMALDAIRQEDIGMFVAAQLARKLSPKTINNRLAVLSSLLKYAADNRVIPRPSLKFTTEGMDSELVAVSMEDVDRLLAVADPLYRAVVLLAAEAGLRAGEIRGLQWTDVKDGQLTVRRALDTRTDEVIAPKHNKSRVVALSDRLVAELGKLPRRGLWVVCRPDGGVLVHQTDLYRRMLDLYAKAEVALPPKPVHCLRHTFGTTLASSGVPLGVIQELMGHSDVKTTMRYVHVNEAQKRAAIMEAFRRGSHVAAENAKPRKA